MTLEKRKPGRWQRPFIGPFSMFQTVAVLAAVALTALLLVFVNTPLANTATPGIPTPGSGFVPVGEPVEGLRIGDIAPEFTGTTPDGQTIQLTDLDGNPISLAALRGRPVWINFFATWCPPCQEETPVLRDTFAAHQSQGLALIAVSVQETTVEDVRAYVQRYSLGYTVGSPADIGSVQAVRVDPRTGEVSGGADARREGTVIVLPRRH